MFQLISNIFIKLFVFLYYFVICWNFLLKEAHKPIFGRESQADTTGPSTSKAGAEQPTKQHTTELKQKTEVDSGDFTEKDSDEGEC